MSQSPSERLFLEYLDRIERREPADFERFCAEYPAEATELRVHYAAWWRSQEALETEPPAARPQGDDVLTRFLRQLESRGDGWRRYRDDGEIARGGMGVIRQVYDEDTRRPLAMKVIRGGGGSSATDASGGVLGRFLEEAQIGAQLQHPGVVPVHDLGVDGEGQVYFTMKLVEGCDLREVFARVRTGADGWTLTRAVGVLQRVCEAMAYAHSKGVIHRDLKPANIMVGEFGEVYVMDWGLSRTLDRAGETLGTARSDYRLESNDDSPLLTIEGDIVGTPAYMPPEQAAGHRERVGAPADVYAMGAVLYHLLVGEPPYADVARSSTDVLTCLVASPPTPIERLRSDSPAELTAICQQAMERSIDDRYPSMEALSGDLRAYLEQRVVAAYATGPLAELRKWVARNRGMAAAIAAAVIVAVVGALLLVRKERQRADEEREHAQLVAAERDLNRAVLEFQTGVLQVDPWEDGREVTAVQLLTRASSRVGESYAGRPNTEAAVRGALGGSLYDLGAYAEAEEQQRLRAALLRESSPEDAWQADLKRCDALSKLGRYADAAEALRAVKDATTAALGPEHLLTLTAARSLGGAIVMLGHWSEAEALLSHTVEALGRTRGPDSEDTLRAMDALGICYRQQRKLAESEEITRRVIEARLRTLGPDAPKTLFALESLAIIVRDQGRFDEAREIQTDLLQRRSEQLGEDHPDTIDSLDFLGNTERQRGDAASSLALFERMLPLARARYDESHPKVGFALQGIGSALVALDRVAEAVPYLERAVGVSREIYAPDHPELLMVMGNLAIAKGRSGDLDGAIELQYELVDGWRRQEGTAGGWTRFATYNLVQMLGSDETRRAERSRVLAAALEEFDAGESPPGEAYWRLVSERVDELTAAGRPDEALEELARRLDAAPIVSWKAPTARSCLNSVVERLTAAGRDDDAADWRARATDAGVEVGE